MKHRGKITYIKVTRGSHNRHYMKGLQEFMEDNGYQYSSADKAVKFCRDSGADSITLEYTDHRGYTTEREVLLNNLLIGSAIDYLREELSPQEFRYFAYERKGNERVYEMIRKQFEYILVREIKYIQSHIREEIENRRVVIND